MTVTITKLPRDNVEVRRNYCSAPIGNGYVQGSASWSSLGAGAMDATGAGVIVKSWTTSPGVVQGAGIRYVDTSWTPGQFRHIVARAYSNGYTPKVIITCTFFDASNNQLASVNSPIQTLVAGFTVGFEGSFQAPGNTHHVNIDLVHAAGSGVPNAGNGIAFSNVLIEAGSYTDVSRYFDGSTYANGNGTQSSYWAGSAGFSQSVIQDFDPANVLVPALSEGWDQVNPGGATILDLIDGTTAAVLAVAGNRRGTFKLYFGGPDVAPAAARAAAEAAAAQLGKAATFTYLDDTLGTLASFAFVLDTGGVRLYVSDTRLSWRLDVAFRQLS